MEADVEVGPQYILVHITSYCVLLQLRFQNVSSSERISVVPSGKTGSMRYRLNTPRENYFLNMMT